MSENENKAEVWREIERRHIGQCLWQVRSPNGRGLLEGVIHKASGAVLIVEKMYDARLPGENSSRSWPALIGLQVYAPVDPGNNTWTGLDEALGAYGKKADLTAPAD